MIVVDATVLAEALGGDGAMADAARARLRGERLVAPHLIDLEVLSAWRRWALVGDMDESTATTACTDLRRLPIERVAHSVLLDRIWEVRINITPYDAAYVALAEQLDVPLVTADGRLARSPGARCRIELVG